jgi:Ca2+-binding EF-hand superfamily protein
MRMFAKLGTAALALGLLAWTGAAKAADDVPGPIDSFSDLQDTAKMIFMMADANRDGQISQKEATDAANLAVGGFFFSADANGDGVLSQQEAQQARDAFLQTRPWLNYVIKTAQATPKPGASNVNQQNPLRALAGVVDANNDKNIQAAELRQAVQTGVQGFFAAADTNRDGQLSPTEANAAVLGMAKSAADASFAAADTDNDGSISQAEWDQAIIAPSRVVFNILDGNHDGKLTQQEAQQAQQVIIAQIRSIRVPHAANSPQNLLRTGRRPSEVAPVPTFGTPTTRPATPGGTTTTTPPAAPRSPQ